MFPSLLLLLFSVSNNGSKRGHSTCIATTCSSLSTTPTAAGPGKRILPPPLLAERSGGDGNSDSDDRGAPTAAGGGDCASSSTTTSTVIDFLDCHHHFYDTRSNGRTFQSFLSRFNPDDAYLPYDYRRDVVDPIESSPVLRDRVKAMGGGGGGGGVRHVGSVHVESMPDDGLEEVRWVLDTLTAGSDDDEEEGGTVEAVVASCNLAEGEETVNRKLRALKEFSPKVRGVRWILDCVGRRLDDDGAVLNPATHVGNLRHDGIDYLETAEEFERGYALLADYGFSFDLQCAPSQLPAAADLCSRHPNVPVVVDHIGKPMRLLGENNSSMMPDGTKLDEWRRGMRTMARLPHAHAKISGLGWAVPNWTRSARRVDLIRSLCRETVEVFGPDRCMINTNWWKDAASSDSDGLGEDGPSADEYLEYMFDFFRGLNLEEQRMLFSGTAKKFYRI